MMREEATPAHMPAERQALLAQARELLAQTRVYEAEQLLLGALAQERTPADLLELLVEVYTRLSAARPQLPIAHFNRAVYLRRLGRLDEAADAYRVAIDLGIDGAADAWSNLGVVLGELERHDEARDAFVQAITVDPKWIPARYNLGLLHEEFGEREAALEQFERVLAIDPEYHDALVRVVHASVGHGTDDALAERVLARLRRTDLSSAAREALSFALGNALDACGRYDEAFAAYSAGNTIARGGAQPYDRDANERNNATLAASFDASWLTGVQSISAAPLVFVCGMWRSGTTLLERMLGGHPALTPGGEISYFSVRMDDESFGWLRSAFAGDPAVLRALGQGYVAMLEQRFPGRRVVDKRPDNWRYIGLLHGLFPAAKFIVMHRDPLDTCLSIFFQQLDAEQLPYSTDLGDIAHQLRSSRELLRHWKTVVPNQILEVQYEDLVNTPEHTLEEVCRFIDLAWDPRMLDFATQRTRVRTASVWQVRQPLHSRSVGRWRHYQTHLRDIVEMLGEERAR